MGKHILVISQYFYPETFRINDIANEWVKRGYNVTVLTGIPNYPEGKFYKDYSCFRNNRETWNGIDIIRIPLIPRGNNSISLVLNYLSFVVSGFFWKCFTRIKADFVFIFEVSPMTQALPGVWYAKKRKIPCYIYVQDLWPENVQIAAGINNQKILNAIGIMVDYIYKRCTKIFVTSQSFAKAVKARGVEEDKVIYWPQYAEDFYKPNADKSKLIPDDGIINITFTGNIGTAQGLDILPETAAELKRQGIRVKFNIIGDGRNKKNLITQINKKQVDDYFNLVGWQPAEDIPSILSASDAAFLSFADNPLYSMTIPAKLQSYMACGIPIIGSVSGESEKIINESNCGIVCQLGDYHALANAIKQFIEIGQETKQQMSKNAECYTKLHFSKDKQINFIDDYFI
ncbi:MAG: glycosyltransferase family 4 protein [Eubacteriales bacterium]|nr:glycosyltransferase family 4 protein [Eubacteriales bacterium]MDD4474326.1 glycosyltransferase family 4 protein [Eubacteriales bacterium]